LNLRIIFVSMPNNYFQFRQFTVFHDKCSMKVNTDGVLLGAWADADNISRALDVGTGSGLIALMIAQRSEAMIDAVEIDPPAALQACENAGHSPWKDRIHVHPGSFQDFASNSAKKYDLIVSNPPFFRNSLKPSDKRRSNARHDLSLTLEELLKGTAPLLNPQGRLCVILPYPEKDDFVELASIYRLYGKRITEVRSTPGTVFSRVLMSFGPVPSGAPERTELTIHEADGSYSEEYRELTKDFYLWMKEY
jgi:tRNA1Val (adenine37-N6)-methyltransferase